ncbi:MAG: hypothetical protein ACPGUV_08355, partial [Polyangiales bacterium]
IYMYHRPWPASLDFRLVFTTTALGFTGLMALAAWPRLRPLAVRLLLVASLVFGAWALWLYLPRTSTHWSQRDLVARYYRLRRGPQEPLIAWLMNWKGENFYTGNHVHVYVSGDNKDIRQWMQAHRGRRIFVLLEHHRWPAFQALMRGRRHRPLSTVRDQNKFILAEAWL